MLFRINLRLTFIHNYYTLINDMATNRVIKMKVGFALMPIALEGLGRISHLINIDTVEDLVILMKTVLTCKLDKQTRRE